METKTCQQCGKTFAKPRVVSKRVWADRRFCSRDCFGKTNKKPTDLKACEICGAEFTRNRNAGEAVWQRRKYCSTACAYQARKGPGHWNWREDGGRFKHGDYWATTLRPDDPMYEMAQVSGRVLEHRLVLARSIGRPLRDHETVHHVNGDRGDNRLGNLELRVGRHGKGANGAHCRTCTCFEH